MSLARNFVRLLVKPFVHTRASIDGALWVAYCNLQQRGFKCVKKLAERTELERHDVRVEDEDLECLSQQ